jgi:hypothetical protein
MKFGTKFWLRRGSIDRKEGLGKARFVLAKLLFARGSQVFVELLEDDDHSLVGMSRLGEKWWASKSSVHEYCEKRPEANEDNYINTGMRRYKP